MKKINISRISFMAFLIFLLGIILSCGNPHPGEEGAENQSHKHSRPVITSITIYPAQPNKESELSLFIQGQNPSGDPVTYLYQWIKNDKEIPGENSNILRSGNYVKGDFIRVRVTPSDENMDGEPFLSDPVKIINMPPVVEEVRIEPKVAYANSELRAIVKGSDSDGDSIQYLYKWEINGVALPDENTDVLKKNLFKSGDSVTVIVTPDDGEAFGKLKKSEPILIANAPPLIVSSPPTQINGHTYLYQIKVEDPGQDSLVYTLKSAPQGMEINKETGLIRWEIKKGNAGTHTIEVEVTDRTGAKCTQKYSLNIAFS